MTKYYTKGILQIIIVLGISALIYRLYYDIEEGRIDMYVYDYLQSSINQNPEEGTKLDNYIIWERINHNRKLIVLFTVDINEYEYIGNMVFNKGILGRLKFESGGFNGKDQDSIFVTTKSEDFIVVYGKSSKDENAEMVISYQDKKNYNLISNSTIFYRIINALELDENEYKEHLTIKRK